MLKSLRALHTCVAPAGVILLALASVNGARSDDLGQRFMTEAPKKWAEYRELSRRLQAEWQLVKRRTGNAAWNEPTERWQIKRDRSGERGLIIAHLLGPSSRFQAFVFNPD